MQPLYHLLISCPLQSHFLLTTHAHYVSIRDSYITEVALFSHETTAVELKLRSDLNYYATLYAHHVS